MMYVVSWFIFFSYFVHLSDLFFLIVVIYVCQANVTDFANNSETNNNLNNLYNENYFFYFRDDSFIKFSKHHGCNEGG